jgi:hypothetical protein
VYSDSLIKQTIETWQSLSNRSVSRRDAEEIIANMTGVINLVRSWSDCEASGGLFSGNSAGTDGTLSCVMDGESK